MRQFTKIEKEAPIDFENFRIHMQREMILRKLKEGGYRITKQRIAVIDIILENDCGSCKEILYKTSKINKKIGTATVYRTLNMLEEIGAINRRNLYKFSEMTEPAEGRVITVMLEDGGFGCGRVEQGVADGSARLWLPERRKGAFCKKCLQNRCNLKKNINKGCYAWLILQKSAIIRQKTTDEEVLYEKS